MRAPLPPPGGGRTLCAFVKKVAESAFQLRVTEAIAVCLEAGRYPPLAAQNHLFAGLAAEHGLEGERRRRQERGPAQHPVERAGELLVGDRVRRREVDRSRADVPVDEAQDGVDLVVDGDPAPPLPPAPDAAAQPELER